jgi:hypothetical protein
MVTYRFLQKRLQITFIKEIIKTKENTINTKLIPKNLQKQNNCLIYFSCVQSN